MTRALTLLLIVIATALTAGAKIVTTTPSVVTLDSAPITIYFNADEGNRGLAGLSASDAVYAHTGVVTSTSSGPTDWQHASTWLDNASKYRMTYVAENRWKLTIPSIKEYYGLTDAELATVEKLMFVFRNATGSREGKTATGGDIAVEVYPAGVAATLTVTPAMRVVDEDTPLTIRVASNVKADIEISCSNKTTQTTLDGGDAFSVSSNYPPGKYDIRAKVVTADTTILLSSSFLCLDKTEVKAYPASTVAQGPELASDGRTARFALAAPGKKNVLLVGSWNDFALEPSQQLSLASQTVELPSDTAYIKNAWTLRQPYFWTEVEGLEPGREYTYYYIVDGTTAVADPYARLILDPDNDRYIPAEVYPQIPEYPTGKVPDGQTLGVLSTSKPSAPRPLSSRPSPDNLIIYELLIRDFTGDGTGSGNIAGLLDRLDYIKSLGVNAVELMPVMEFSGNNSWGYNPTFYFAPDKAYGSPADYRRLVDELHARDIAVILDVVFNQADGGNPRYQMYAPAENPFFNATPPHAYNVFNDWNQDNPLVFSQWVDALRYWTEAYGIDGFRLDLVKGMGDNGSYGIAWNRTTNSFASPSESTTNRYNPSRVERMRRLKAALAETLPEAYFICEDLATAEEDRGLAAFGAMDWANVNYASCQWAMGWSDGADLSRFYAPLDGYRPFGSTVSYAESHDEERMAYKQQRWGQEAVKRSEAQRLRRLGSVAAMMLMTPGTHMIWQFEELGDAQAVKNESGDNNTSPRASAWHLLDRPLNASLRATYASLIAFRRANPALFTGEATVDMAATQTSWNNGYTLSVASPSGERIFLVANPLTDKDLTIAVPDGMTIALASADTESKVEKGELTLLPGAFAILANDAVTAIALPEEDNVDTQAPAELFTIDGRRIVSPAPGAYILRRGATATKIIVR